MHKHPAVSATANGHAAADNGHAPAPFSLGAARQAGMDEAALARAVAAALGVEVVDDLHGRHASAQFLAKVPIGYARQHRMIGLAAQAVDDAHAGDAAADGDEKTTADGRGFARSGRMQVAVADLAGWRHLDLLSRFLGRPVRPVIAPASAIAAAINAAYQQRGGQAQSFIDKLDKRDVLAELEGAMAATCGNGREDLLDVATRAPVIKLVNLMLFEAVRQQASDAHVQPYEDKLVVRLRIDGVLFDAFELPKALQDEVVSRVKVMGRMNIAEKRLAQDGRATVQVGDRLVDLRIASLPTSFGERVVIRLLDKSARLYTLNELGMPPDVLPEFRTLIGVEHGLILVTGPTGSGKSTTLYAALQELDAQELNATTRRR